MGEISRARPPSTGGTHTMHGERSRQLRSGNAYRRHLLAVFMRSPRRPPGLPKAAPELGSRHDSNCRVWLTVAEGFFWTLKGSKQGQFSVPEGPMPSSKRLAQRLQTAAADRCADHPVIALIILEIVDHRLDRQPTPLIGHSAPLSIFILPLPLTDPLCNWPRELAL